MIPIKKALTSSIGKKYVMGVTGLSLIGFMFTHLYGNLFLYWPDPDAFNGYTKSLHDWGAWLTVAEFGLLGLFVTHIAMALWLQKDKIEATRSKQGTNKPLTARYFSGFRSKGGPSNFGISSKNMILTGVVLGIFLVLHVLHFRFAIFGGADYTTMLHGEQARDLYTLVSEELGKPHIAVLYLGVIGFLGFHIRHGFWSALQSLGAMKPEWSKAIYAVGAGVAFFLFVGFFLIPIWFMFDVPGRL